MKSLQHSGVEFPDPFVPSGEPLACRTKLLKLTPDAEEIAVAWARYVRRKMDGDVRKKAVHNFWKDFLTFLHPKDRIGLYIDHCDFDAVEAAHKIKKIIKNNKIKKIAIIDGAPVEMGNVNVGPPGVFMGRGAYNKHLGKIRRRIVPEDVTLNLSKGAPVPKTPRGHAWGRIVYEKDARWLAKWKDPVTGVHKYVRVSPSAPQSSSNTREKFEVVRKLLPKFDKIIRKNQKNLQVQDERTRQLATCVALMCDLAIRVGKSGSRHVFGAATLLKRHVNVTRQVDISFIGKDGVPYRKRAYVPSDPRITKNLFIYSEGEKNGRLFDMISPHAVNAYVATLDKTLTTKVIRTIRANQVFISHLVGKRDETAKDIHMNALLAVADLCNHRTGEKLSVSTSLANYLDPRTTFEFARDMDVPPSRLFPRALLAKFEWARKEISN